MMRWGRETQPVRWRVGVVGTAILWAMIFVFALAADARGQVSARVEIRDGHGEAHVLNHRPKSVQVEAAVWESKEEPEVQLIRKADARVWPSEFTLEPGEKQTVRILVPDSAYAEGTMLRLETVLTPVEGEQAELAGSPAGVRTELKFAYRFLSRVYVR